MPIIYRRLRMPSLDITPSYVSLDILRRCTMIDFHTTFLHLPHAEVSFDAISLSHTRDYAELPQSAPCDVAA